MRLAIGSDHAAIAERLSIVAHLEAKGHDVYDLGCPPNTTTDYPDIARLVAREVAGGRAERGVLLCGTGIGVAMAACKVPGIRAATLHDEFTAEMSRRHNDAQIACFGARSLAVAALVRLVDLFLATPFDGGRHARRIEKIAALDADAARRSAAE